MAGLFKEGQFYTVGGPFCKTWDYSLSSQYIGSAFYRLTGKIQQGDNYTYDKLKMTLTLFCNGETNVVKSVEAEDEYVLRASVDGNYGQTNGTGSMYVYVYDIYYGQYSCTYYN